MKIISSRLHPSIARSDFLRYIRGELKNIQEAGTYKHERVITSSQGVEITIDGRSKPVLNFCANNYLGLSSHPEVIKAGNDAMSSHGAGLSSVRFICGTQNIHRELEKKIAAFHGREDAILYSSCFDANGGIFDAVFGSHDTILSDELNHASIIDGTRLSKAGRFRYKHADMADLETQLIVTRERGKRVIVTDGVFSMDGDLAPLKEICYLAEKYKALVFVDDCHATGFFGKTGRGTEEYLGVMGQVDIINSTLGKALGGTMGGYTTGPKPLIDYLRQKSRPYLFSNSLAPSLVGCSLKVLDLLMKDSSYVEQVRSNVKLFRSLMTAAGFKVMGDEEHPICPIMLGDARLATKFADEMLINDIYVIGFSYPVVPKGAARIRVQISAAHSENQIVRCVDAFKKVGRNFNVI